MDKMEITCYGPRGSRPAASRKGFSTVEFGGDTNCYYVKAGPFRIILDDGTGVAILGDDLMKNGIIGESFINLITHYHWDHLDGMSFCIPYFIGTNTFHIHGPIPSGYEATGQPRSAVEMMLAIQQSNPLFPVAHECLPARKLYTGHARQFSNTVLYTNLVGPTGKQEYRQIENISDVFLKKDLLKITTIPLNHPDGCLGYRIDWMDMSIAYCTDNEPFRKPNAQITKLAKNVNWLLLDGQYDESEIGGMQQGFGHGTPQSCIEQAMACDAKFLVVSHHEPKRNDTSLSLMEQEARGFAHRTGFSSPLEFAREGRVWNVTVDGVTCLEGSNQ
jgi:phosphoribosyl 1,2-cyclic phosphodiesterase